MDGVHDPPHGMQIVDRSTICPHLRSTWFFFCTIRVGEEEKKKRKGKIENHEEEKKQKKTKPRQP